MICSVTGCDKPARKRSWCESHYARWRTTGDPITPYKRFPSYAGVMCSEIKCGAKARRNGVCSKHSEAAKKTTQWKAGRCARDLERLEKLMGRPRPILCEACRKRQAVCFDHDHATSKPRGWLCHPCNLALGLMTDDPDMILNLAAYAGRTSSE